MKIRQGFVSNSSSSSFICMVSGHVEAGMDMGLDDAEMYECENGHYFCEQFLIGEIDDHEEDYRYEVKSKHCPICSMNHLSSDIVLRYLVKTGSVDVGMIKNQIKGKFDNYQELEKALRE